MQVRAATYFEYLQLIKGKDNSQIRKELDQLIKDFRNSQKIYSKLNAFYYIVDYTTSNYLFLDESSQNILGYPVQYFLSAGHLGFYDKIHPADREVILNSMFPQIFKILKRLPFDKYKHIVTSMNYRFLNGNGEYIMLLQKHSYLPGKTLGNPAGAMGVIYDISHFKDDLSVVHTIEELIQGEDGVLTKLLYKKVYPALTKSIFELSRREKEILKYLAAGWSSKQIAAKCKISINTVNNHRKKMLRKTGSKSTAGLLSTALTHGFR